MSRVLISLLLTLIVAGCGSLSSGLAPTGATDSGGDASADGGVGTPGSTGDAGADSQAGFGDGGAASDFPGFPADSDYSAGFTSGESRDGNAADPATRLSCSDGLDNDSSGGADCADPACQSLGSCCVGRGDCCVDLGAGSPLPALLDVSGCVGTDGTACVESLTTRRIDSFGFPGAFLDHMALAPGGDATADAGLLLGEPVDLRTHSVTLEADLTDAEDCGATCLESVAFGIVPDGPVGRVVRPLVALLSSPSLRQVRLIVGDEVVKSFSTEAAMAGAATHWTLTLRPEGRVRVESDIPSMDTFEAPFAPIAQSRVVIYGRSRNPSASGVGGARINNIATQVSLCDMPNAWQARQPVAFFEGGNPAATATIAGLSSPDLVRDESAWQTFAAFASGGAILVTTVDASGVQLDAAAHIMADAEVVWQAGGFDSPALLRPDGRVPEVYFTAHGADGVDRIGVATEDGAGGFSVLPTAAIDPTDFGLLSLFEPTAFEHEGSATLLLARARDDSGTHLEAFYRTALTSAFTRIENSNLSALTQSDSAAADADEVMEPSLVLFDHAWHLYVARRQGARYSLGLLASDELLAWRWVSTDALSGSGDSADFDALGVRSPAALRDGDGVELLYVGLDGANTTIGRTQRVANSGEVMP